MWALAGRRARCSCQSPMDEAPNHSPICMSLHHTHIPTNTIRHQYRHNDSCMHHYPTQTSRCTSTKLTALTTKPKRIMHVLFKSNHAANSHIVSEHCSTRFCCLPASKISRSSSHIYASVRSIWRESIRSLRFLLWKHSPFFSLFFSLLHRSSGTEIIERERKKE